MEGALVRQRHLLLVCAAVGSLILADTARAAESDSYVATTLTSGRVRNMEHTSASKSFYLAGAWWAVLPSQDNWYVHRFDGPLPAVGQLGGWTRASTPMSTNAYSADIAWNAAAQKLYVLNDGPDTSTPTLWRLGYVPAGRTFAVEAQILLAGNPTTEKLHSLQWRNNPEMALGLDQQGVPLVSVVGPSPAGGQAGLYVAYPTTGDPNGTWAQVTLDPNTSKATGDNGNSKSDFVAFNPGGVNKVGFAYSADNGAGSTGWRIAYHDTPAAPTGYGGGWALSTITDKTVDNHVAARWDGTSLFIALKNAFDTIYLVKGVPGAWAPAVKVHNGHADSPPHAASRPVLVLDQDNRQVYVFYQESVVNPYGSIFYKKSGTATLSFDSAAAGTKILTSGGSEDMIDPQPPVHNVGAATGGKFFMFAKDEDVPKVWYNDIDLLPPAAAAARPQGQRLSSRR